MGCMEGQLTAGRSIRTLNALDDFNRENLGINVDFALPGECVVRSLNQIIEWRRNPKGIRVGNGPEYTSKTLMAWVDTQGVRLEYTQPVNPQHNAYVERYNRAVRNEWRGQYISETIEAAQNQATWPSHRMALDLQ